MDAQTLTTKEEKIMHAIQSRHVLRFLYHQKPRTVEPQTVGIGTKGTHLLRGYVRNAPQNAGLRLFDVSQISSLVTLPTEFVQAHAQHNPDDKAMETVLATLPRPHRP